jgi:hypothetical protein
MFGELQRMRQPCVPREIGWCRDDKTRHAAQPPRDQRGIRQRADSQCRIEAVADEIDCRIAQVQVDRHIGIGVQKIRQDGRDMAQAE